MQLKRMKTCFREPVVQTGQIEKSTTRAHYYCSLDDTASACGAWILQSVLNREPRHYLLSKKGIYSDSLDAHVVDQSLITGPANNVSWGLQMELHTRASCVKETSVNTNRPWVTYLCWCWGRAWRPGYCTSYSTTCNIVRVSTYLSLPLAKVAGG